MRILLASVLTSFLLTSFTVAQRNFGNPFVYENEAGQTMPYRLFTPPESTSGVDLPLVVFLHGAGETGTDNRLPVAVHINGLIAATQEGQYPAYLLVPQVPSDGNGWSADGVKDLGIEIVESLSASLPIDTNRTYVTGLSMGGFGSFNYITQHPDKFAAAVPMSGGYDPSAADLIKDIPIWSFHGDRDTTVSPQGSREMYDAITQAGGTTHLSEVVASSHVIWSRIYGDASLDNYGLYDWLFSQTLDRRESETLIPFGSEWSYVDDGSDQGELWRATEYDDGEWKRGAAPLGFGYNDEATVVACGSVADCEIDKHATFYFRKEFTVDDPSQLENVMAQVERDDGAIVYVNGVEVFRDANIRSTTTFDTFARTHALDNGHSAFRIDDSIVAGVNTIAIELHQTSREPTDLRFDLRLTAVAVPEPSTLSLCLVGCVALYLRRHA